MAHIHRLQDEVDLPASETSRSRSLLIYFIPGNPGLVEYYRGFLVDLQNTLEKSDHGYAAIYGASHDGFEVHPTASPRNSHGHEPPYSLAEVVEGTKRKLSAKADQILSENAAQSLDVILIGHSLGSYILLDVASWWQHDREAQNRFTIVGGVCLFPTVTKIGESKKGKNLTRLLFIPYLPVLAQVAANMLSFVPLWLWNWPKTLTPNEKRPEHCAVTEAIVRGPQAARQTLHMAADEIRTISGDKWHPVDFWETLPHQHLETNGHPIVSEVDIQANGNSNVQRAKLFFYWGEDDYWVENKNRDKLIAERARRADDHSTKHWPHMMIDRHQMDHCFSLNAEHSKMVAGQVGEWIEEMLQDKP